MNVLFAVKSCLQHRDEGRHVAIIDTWGQDIPSSGMLWFFTGRPEVVDGDWSQTYQNGQGKQAEFLHVMNVKDDYDSLPHKTREILKFSITRGYDGTWLCDTDTFILVSKLMKSGFENFDYFGKISRPLGKTFPYAAIDRHGDITDIPDCFGWASGGHGYFVSRKAARIIVDHEPVTWAEDLEIGQVMGKAYNEGLVKIGDMAPNICTWHAPLGSDSQKVREWVQEMYRTHK